MKKLALILVIGTSFLLSSTEVSATQSNLKCQPSTGTYQVGETFLVDLILDTRSFQAQGADVVATYSKDLLESTSTQVSPITTSTSWTVPTTNTIGVGAVRLDYGKNQTAWTGSGSIGQITFKAKAEGQAKFEYTFFQQYDDTTADGGAAKVWGQRNPPTVSNILTDVNSCTYVIEGVEVPPTSPPAATSAPVPTELPRSGTVEVTVSLLGIAGLFLIIGTILPAISSRKN